MVVSFDAQGDRHSGSLACHWIELTALGRNQDKADDNIKVLVEECTILHTQVESMGDNLCRWGVVDVSLEEFH